MYLKSLLPMALGLSLTANGLPLLGKRQNFNGLPMGFPPPGFPISMRSGGGNSQGGGEDGQSPPPPGFPFQEFSSNPQAALNIIEKNNYTDFCIGISSSKSGSGGSPQTLMKVGGSPLFDGLPAYPYPDGYQGQITTVPAVQALDRNNSDRVHCEDYRRQNGSSSSSKTFLEHGNGYIVNGNANSNISTPPPTVVTVKDARVVSLDRHINATSTDNVTFSLSFNSTSDRSISLPAAGNNTSSNGNYNIDGVVVPRKLSNFQPNAIQQACSRYLSEGPAGGNSTRAEIDLSDNEAENTGPAAFKNVFAGYNSTEKAIEDQLVPATAPEPYSTSDFDAFRRLCAELASTIPEALGFIVTTDFQNNFCSIYFGNSVTSNTDFRADPSAGKALLYIEAWNKALS